MKKLLFVVLICPLYCFPNNILISNVSIQNSTATTTKIQFDVQWQNSWRNDLPGTGNNAPNNYDAAWIFIKFKGTDGIWHHANLDLLLSNHSSGSLGNLAALSIPNDGKGAFIYRGANGSGTFNSTGVQLQWNYSQDGVSNLNGIEIKVFAIETVYIPQGAFYVGDGTDGTGDPGNIFQGQLRKAESNTPFQITSENTITLGGTAVGNLNSTGGSTPPDDFNTSIQTLPANYPKGFNAFYCMKYEITQSQYVDFLNTLTYNQQATVTSQLTATPQYASVPPNAVTGTKAIITTQGNSNFRNFVEIKTPGIQNTQAAVYGVDADEDNIYNEDTDGGNIACGYLTWLDGCAYADWSGLRPMSQLEYEKACRGPLIPIPNEFAWGNNTRIEATGLQNQGEENEIATNSAANVCASNFILGPVRVGMFARANTTRAQSGSTYYGVMEMSGNVWERVPALGRVQGRAFIPNLGDGDLSTNGYANVTGWTGLISGEITTGLGTGFVGGNFFRTADFNNVYFNYALLRVSGRLYANTSDTVRFSGNGFRCVRSAN